MTDAEKVFRVSLMMEGAPLNPTEMEWAWKMKQRGHDLSWGNFAQSDADDQRQDALRCWNCIDCTLCTETICPGCGTYERICHRDR